METTDEIMQEIREKRAAGKIVKRYKDAKRHIKAMEKDRPFLLSAIEATPGKYKWDDYQRYRDKMAGIVIPKEDAGLLQEYIDSLEIVNTVETAIRERLDTPRKEEAVDLFLHGMSAAELMERYTISMRTVRRIWKKGLDSVEKEIALRIGCGRSL